jgi:Protein of unknown function (DUF1272)
MALELRPNCEYCDKDLPPASTEARICTYECTFCAGYGIRFAPFVRIRTVPELSGCALPGA